MDITYTTPRAFVITAGAILAPCPPEPPTECSVPGCSAEAGPLPGPTSGRDLCPEHRDDERHELERTA